MKLLFAAVVLCYLGNAHGYYGECKNTGWACGGAHLLCSFAGIRADCRKTCKACPDLPATCGMRMARKTRVISGDDANRGDWPWQILMLKWGRPGCGGTIISNRWVVTAAHCVHDEKEIDPRLFHVRVGEHDRNIKEGSEVTHTVEKVIKHPKYDPKKLNNDIALFKLTKPIIFNEWVQPACLPESTEDVPAGTNCYITGWGKIKSYGKMHTLLQQAKMPVVSNEVCHALNFEAIKVPITDAMICTGDAGKTRVSGCHGDSGGPLVCLVNGKWELHGDVSHGSSRCSSWQTYTVFARVHYFKEWIKDMMMQ